MEWMRHRKLRCVAVVMPVPFDGAPRTSGEMFVGLVFPGGDQCGRPSSAWHSGPSANRGDGVHAGAPATTDSAPGTSRGPTVRH